MVGKYVTYLGMYVVAKFIQYQNIFPDTNKKCCPWKNNFVGTENSIFEVIPLCSIWQWSCKYFSMGFFQVESFFSIFLCALHCAKPLVLEFIRTPGFIYLDKQGGHYGLQGCFGMPNILKIIGNIILIFSKNI